MQTWDELTRQLAPPVFTAPQLYTMLPVPNPFVVPGARFREVCCLLGSVWGRCLLARRVVTLS